MKAIAAKSADPGSREGPVSRPAALLIFIGIGLVLTFGGLYSATIAPVDCHDKPMRSGDVCKTYNRPSQTYDEMRTIQRSVGWVMFGLGPAVLVWAVVTATRASRRSKQPQQPRPPGLPAPGAPSGMPPQRPTQRPAQPPGQSYYPPPYYPPPNAPPPGARAYYAPPPRGQHYPPPHYPRPGPYRPPPPRR